MAHEIPPQYRAILNPREVPATRADRLWALHAELSTPQGLLLASSWLPPAWPHLLQLLADPHPEVRSAAAQLLGRLGAALASRQEPRLAPGRMPPSALLDWGLALLSPASTLPAAQRMSADAKEAALSALHVCVAALPPPDAAPHAQPLLRLTSALLEATSTPPRLLGPLLRLLLAALPAVPLAELGQGFGDLADLLCGWALEPLVAAEDRQLITLILHALRPQWHSHPDLTASLTENMLSDVQAAAASTAAAAAAATEGGEDIGDAAAQAAACLQLVQLLCDIFSAASLRQLPLPQSQAGSSDAGGGAAPAPGYRGQLATLIPVVANVAQPRPQAMHPHPHHLVQRQQLHQGHASHHYQHYQHQHLPPGPPSPMQPHGANAVPPAAAPLALTAILRTRPGAAAVRHLLSLYPRLLATLKEVRDSLVRLDEAVTPVGRATSSLSPSGADPWADQLCGCVETLADSVASCVAGSDPRDLDEVWEGLEYGVLGGLAALTLRDRGQDQGPSNKKVEEDLQAGRAIEPLLTGRQIVYHGVIGATAAAAAPEAVGACRVVREANDGAAAPGGGGSSGADRWDGSGAPPSLAASAQAANERYGALHSWALRAALRWAMELLGGNAAEGPAAGGRARRWPRAAVPGPDADALTNCAARLLERAAQRDAGAGRRLVVESVLEGEGAGVGVCGLRSLPLGKCVSAAAKLLQALLSHGNDAVATASLDWLLADLRRRMSALLPPSSASRSQLFGGASASQQQRATAADQGRGGTDGANAVAFDCAVLQAACQRGWLAGSRGALLQVEAVMWKALQAATVPPPAPPADPSQTQCAAGSAPAPDHPSGDALAGSGHGSTTPEQSSEASPLPASVVTALCDAWAAAAAALIAAVYTWEHSAASPSSSVCAPSTAGPPGPVAGAVGPPLPPGAHHRHRPPGSATQACCSAFLSAVHSLQAGSASPEGGTGAGGSRAGAGDGKGLQLCALSALRQLLRSPAVAASGALRGEQLLDRVRDSQNDSFQTPENIRVFRPA